MGVDPGGGGPRHKFLKFGGRILHWNLMIYNVGSSTVVRLNQLIIFLKPNSVLWPHSLRLNAYNKKTEGPNAQLLRSLLPPANEVARR